MPYLAHEDSKEHFNYSDVGPDDLSLSLSLSLWSKKS